MNIGVALNIVGSPGESDKTVINNQLAIGDLVEPLGFYSLFTLEHHFSDYIISPSPLQLLTYFAARTKHIKLGTSIIVLPLHNPIHIAEQISMLEILSNERGLYAVGRGSSESEFEGFGISEKDTHRIFSESLAVLKRASRHDSFNFQGQHFSIPDISIRPSISRSVANKLYMPTMSERAVEFAVNNKLGMLMATDLPLLRLSQLINSYRATSTHEKPILFATAFTSHSKELAKIKSREYLHAQHSLMNQHYAGTPSSSRPMPTKGDSDFIDYAGRQIFGTPDECIEKITALHEATNFAQLVLEFSFGGMPLNDSINSMETFAGDVLPAIPEQ